MTSENSLTFHQTRRSRLFFSRLKILGLTSKLAITGHLDRVYNFKVNVSTTCNFLYNVISVCMEQCLGILQQSDTILHRPVHQASSQYLHSHALSKNKPLLCIQFPIYWVHQSQICRLTQQLHHYNQQQDHHTQQFFQEVDALSAGSAFSSVETCM